MNEPGCQSKSIPASVDIDEGALLYTTMLFEPDELAGFIRRVMDMTCLGLEEMESLLAAGQIAAIYHTAHRIKNPCSYLGARSLVSILKELETASSQNELHRIRGLLDTATVHLEKYRQSYEIYLK